MTKRLRSTPPPFIPRSKVSYGLKPTMEMMIAHMAKRPCGDLKAENRRLRKALLNSTRDGSIYRHLVKQQEAMLQYRTEKINQLLRGHRPPPQPGFLVSTDHRLGPHSLHLTNDLTGEHAHGRFALVLNMDAQDMYCGIPGAVEIQKGYNFRVLLPDGTRIETDDDGVAKIDTADQQTIYRSPVKDGFNPYLNASDLLGEFMEVLAARGVVQEDLQRVPVGTFINWLIHRAAEADGEAPPPDVPLALPRGSDGRGRRLRLHFRRGVPQRSREREFGAQAGDTDRVLEVLGDREHS